MIIDKLTYAGNQNNLLSIRNESNYNFIKADICDGKQMEDAINNFLPDVNQTLDHNIPSINKQYLDASGNIVLEFINNLKSDTYDVLDFDLELDNADQTITSVTIDNNKLVIEPASALGYGAIELDYDKELASKLAETSLGAEVSPVGYLWDTVADVLTIKKARERCPTQKFISFAVSPPHLHGKAQLSARESYENHLKNAGADVILNTTSEILDHISHFWYFIIFASSRVFNLNVCISITLFCCKNWRYNNFCTN